MKLRETIIMAINTRNIKLVGKICEILDLKFGMNYQQTYEFVNKITPIDLNDWEELIYESEFK